MRRDDLPGTRLLAVACRWFDRETVATVFEPLIADWQHECRNALSRRDRLHAQASGWLALLTAVAHTLPRWLVRLPPRTLMQPIAVRALAFCSIATILLMWPFVAAFSRSAVRWYEWLYLLPSAGVLPLVFVALPLAHQLRELTVVSEPSARRLLIQSVAFLIVINVAMLAWVVPNANQAWRTAVYATLTRPPSTSQQPLRGLRELTVPQLLTKVREEMRAQAAQREIHGRAALAVSPIVMGALGWTVAIHLARKKAAWVFVCWVVVGVGFYQLRVLGRGVEDAYTLPIGAGMWVPHLPVALSLVLHSVCERAYCPTDRKHPPMAPLAP